MRYLAAAAALTATLFVYAFFDGLAGQPPTRSRPVHAGCTWQPGLPTNERVCPNMRVYVVPGWVDVGPVTPVPGVPRK